MARLIPNNKLTKYLIESTPNQTVENVVFAGGKLIRLKILYDRENRGFQKEDINGPKDAFETSGLSIFETGKLEREKAIREGKADRLQVSIENDAYTSQKYTGKKQEKIKDYIAIVDYDFRDEDKAVRGYSKLILPFVPREVSYEPSSKFVGIATMGRNTPFYQFTGSEDSLKFEIDWYSLNKEDLDRKNVINACRWVEALTKSNAYEDLPHRVKLVWGKNDLLWQDDLWIVTEAPYVLSQFTKGYKSDGEFLDIGMMPAQAIQTVTLKRVMSNNRTTQEILGNLRK